MRTMLTLALFLGSIMTLRADTVVYVSLAKEQKIQSFRLDPNGGKLSAIETVSVDGAPGCLTVDPKRKHLFASLRSTSKLASFAIDPATGKLKALGSVDLPKDENAAFISTDRTGKWLFSASYAAGKIVVHEIKDDGSLRSPAVQTIATTKTAHCAMVDRDNQWVFVPHVAPNAVFQYKLDAATGKLTDAGKARGGSEKAGPRHFAWHPTKNLGFTSNEVENSITAYAFDPKTGLDPTGTVTTLPAEFKEKNTTAEVKVHPNGKFVWVSNRGHDSLAGFSIADSGKLTPIGQTPTEKTPRSFDIEPNGRFLFSAGEGTGKLAIYEIDTGNGKLTPLYTQAIGQSLTWVVAMRIGE